ncbi:unnamed protein product [Linum trigynum]|uniref:Uncharacterized protein n=1 Tax=Linum trigynum TaxID=586398 RepID=A0AAV2GPS7_9ROSI
MSTSRLTVKELLDQLEATLEAIRAKRKVVVGGSTVALAVVRTEATPKAWPNDVVFAVMAEAEEKIPVEAGSDVEAEATALVELLEKASTQGEERSGTRQDATRN